MNNHRKILYLNSDDDINGFIGGVDDIHGHTSRKKIDKSIVVTKKDSHSDKKSSFSQYVNDDYKFSPSDISQKEYKRRKREGKNGINSNEDNLSMTNSKESDHKQNSDDEKNSDEKNSDEEKSDEEKSDEEKSDEEKLDHKQKLDEEKKSVHKQNSDEEKKSVHKQNSDEETDDETDAETDEEEETDDGDSENNDDDECNSMTTDELLTLDPLRLTNFLQFKNQNISEILSGVRDELKKLNKELKRRQKKRNN
jgi:hypothetical protein